MHILQFSYTLIITGIISHFNTIHANYIANTAILKYDM